MTKVEKQKDIKFYTNLIYFIVVVLFVCIRICAGFGLFNFLGTYASYIMSLVTQIGLVLLLPLLLFRKLTKLSNRDTLTFFNFNKISVKSVLASIALGLVVFVLNVYVSSFFNGLIGLFGYKSASSSSTLPVTWWTLVLNLFCTAVLPAICEETLHRGMLLNGNLGFGVKKAILLSGFLFGLLHCNIEQFFYATIIGLFLGYLCMGCGSIYPCIIVHFMNNACSVLLSFARAKGWGIGNIFSAVTQFLIEGGSFVAFVLCLAIFVYFAFVLTRFLIKDSFEYNFVRRQKELTTLYIREEFFNDIENIKNDTNFSPTMSEENKKIVYIDAKDFFDFFSRNMQEIIHQAQENASNNDMVEKADTKTKIFVWGAIVLTSIITILTFIWGLL